MKFNIYILVFGLLLISLSGFANRLDATFDLTRFKATKGQGFVEIYCTVNGNSVIYKKINGGYQASVALEFLFKDKDGAIKYADKVLMRSPFLLDTTGSQGAFNLQQRVFLPYGIYTFTGKARDVNNKFEAQSIEVPVEVNFNDTEVQFSDIQLLESYTKSDEKNDYTKSGYKLISYVSNFYPQGFDKLKFYTEIYNAEAALGKDKQMVIFYRIYPRADNFEKLTVGGQKIVKTANVNAILHELDLSTLRSGNYELVVEVRDDQNKLLANHKRFIQRSNPVADKQQTGTETVADLTKNPKEELPEAFALLTDSLKLNTYILSLKPIANAVEGVNIESVAKSATMQQKRNYLYSFWLKRNNINPSAAWNEYRVRIDYVQGTFANKAFYGYETDMGRVYLQYGPPNMISNERNDVNRPVMNTDTRPYQIWNYYNLANQRNRIFVFIQQNLGNNNYNLVHSTANGEISDNTWRQQAAQRMNGNDSDRNNPKGRSYDRDGNDISGR